MTETTMSDLMRIPGFSRYLANVKTGRIWNLSGAEMAETTLRNGYRQVRLVDDGGVRRTCRVHRLICLAAFGESDLEVNHLDGDKGNNSAINLEYCTHAENMRHYAGTRPPTEVCLRGHMMDGVRKDRPHLKYCKVCNRENKRRWRKTRH